MAARPASAASWSSLRPDAFPGLIPVCRRLLGLPTPTIVLISRPQDEGLRSRLTPAVAEVLGRVRNVQVVGPSQLAGTVSDPRPARMDPNAMNPGAMDAEGMEREALAGAPGRLTVVDSSDPLDLVHPPELTATVLVVREGIRSAALRDAVVEHLGGSAEARVILVKPGRRTGGQDVSDAEVTEEVRPREAGASIT